jgi:hypothetical protein
MLKKIAPDKWKHFYVGIPMGAALQGLGMWILSNHPVISTSLALLIVIIISYGFELFSKITGLGRYDFMDAVASIIGGVLGMAIVWAVVWAWFPYMI